MTEDATPRAIPIDEAWRFSDETPKRNPRQTSPTAPSVAGEECVLRRNHEKRTVKGRTSPRAI